MIKEGEIRNLVSRFAISCLRLFGSRLVDQRTGQRTQRVFAIAFRGKIHVVGLEEPMKVEFEPQARLTYWNQSLVFRSHEQPDFPRTAKEIHKP